MNETVVPPMNNAHMQELRKTIDELDRELIAILAERFAATNDIGRLKHRLAMPPFQHDRWKEVLNSRVTAAASKGFETNFATQLFTLIHDASVAQQCRTIAREGASHEDCSESKE